MAGRRQSSADEACATWRRAWIVLSLGLALHCAEPSPPGPVAAPNLLVISADSLRADRLALWNPGDGVQTPHLEELAAGGTLFANTWAVTPWTAPSLVSLFTGLYPPSHGVAYRDDTTPSGLPTLPRLAEKNGYRVGNFSFFAGISYFRNLGLPAAALGLRHGRETEAFRQWLVPDSPVASTREASAPRPPFFAWIHLLEPHLPYGASGYEATRVQIPGSSGLERAQLQATVPVGSVEFAEGDRAHLLSLYDADLLKLDEAVGGILAVLEEAGVDQETVIVFVADHGEELLEHGWVGHASTAVQAKLVPETLHIPFLLAGPGVAPGVVSQTPAQHVDVLPTLAPLLGWTPPPHQDGIDLLAVERPGAEGGASFLDGLWRFFRRPTSARGAGRMAFFDSSMGGNLTPRSRRGERLQGASDGRCLWVAQTVPGKAEESWTVPLHDDGPCHEEELRRALEEWRQRQGEGRLAVLSTSTEGSPPTAGEVESYAQTLTVVEPGPGARLDWRGSSGQVRLEWQGSSSSWIEYDIGQGLGRVRGTFLVEPTSLVFGPFPKGFWNDLAGYSPFRFRVLDPVAKRRSAWQRFEVLPAQPGDDTASSPGEP